MKTLLALALMAVAFPAAALCQSAPDSPLERRLRALEAEVRDLKAELVALRAAQAAEAAATPRVAPEPPAAIAAAAAAPQTAAQDQHGGPVPEYAASTAKTLNPDIGVIGNFLGAAGRSGGGSDSLAPLPAFTLQESEASFQAVVDPFARADFFLAVGEKGIEVEEGYITFPTVPGGLLVKAGKMRASFGRLNTFHNHTLPWVDRPLCHVQPARGSDR